MMRRPWCAKTRILEHRETERQNQEAEERKKQYVVFHALSARKSGRGILNFLGIYICMNTHFHIFCHEIAQLSMYRWFTAHLRW